MEKSDESVEIDNFLEGHGKAEGTVKKPEVNLYAKHGIRMKLAKTVASILCASSMGLYTEIVGPTMPDLQRNIAGDYEEISRCLVAKSVGYCCGTILAGLFAQRFPLHLELVVALSSLLGAVGAAVTPWCTQLWILAVIFHFQGWGQGFFNNGSDTLVLSMWGKKAASPIHLLHFGFGFGAVLAPQLARPFISQTNTHDFSANENGTLGDVSKTTMVPFNSSGLKGNLDDESRVNNSNIQVLYSIIAVLAFVFFVTFLTFYLLAIKKRKAFASRLSEITASSKFKFKAVLKSLSPGSCTGGRTIFGAVFFSLLFIYFLNYVGGERSIARFIFSYAVNTEHNFSSDEAATLNSLYWIGFTVGRALAGIIAYWCPPLIFLTILLVLNIVTCSCLAIWGLTSAGVLWVFTALLGLVMSPLFAACYAWANLYVELKGLAVTVIYIGCSVGAIFYQWLTGYLFEYVGPESLMYVILGFSLCISTTFLLLFLVVRKQEKLSN